MPSKFVTRNFEKDQIYHIYNRGVDGRRIFQNDEDYRLFLYYLFIYLTPLEKVLRRYHSLPIRLFQKNLSKDVELLCYALLPDHFHMVIRQKGAKGISQLMKQVSNAYTQYFNTTYKRTGTLFEGTYKSVHVKKELLLTMSRFVHREPSEKMLEDFSTYEWSSYGDYTKDGVHRLCHTKDILQRFPSVYAYKKFVSDHKDYKKKLPELAPFLIERL